MDINSVLKEYRKHLKIFLLSRVVNKCDLEDILQDTLIKIFRYFKNHGAPHNLNSWVYKVAQNTLIDYYRKNKHDYHEKLNELEESEIVNEDNKSSLELLSKCLIPFFKKLPKKYRELLELVALQNISQIDLSKKMNLSYSGIKSRVQRARKMLLNQYNECCDFELDARGSIVDFKPKYNCCNL